MPLPSFLPSSPGNGLQLEPNRDCLVTRSMFVSDVEISQVDTLRYHLKSSLRRP